MKEVNLICLSNFKYGEKSFKKDELYTASIKDDLYHIKNGEEVLLLENLSVFFKDVEGLAQEHLSDRRIFTSKEEICKRMKWEDFEFTNGTVFPKDIEKVGVSQYTVIIDKNEYVVVKIKTEHNKNPLIQKSQTYEELLEKLNVSADSIVVAKLLDRWTGFPVDDDASCLLGEYSFELQGFLS